MWRIMREKKNKTAYRARRAAAEVTPTASARKRSIASVASLRPLPSKCQSSSRRVRRSMLSSGGSVGSFSSIELGDCDTSDSEMCSESEDSDCSAEGSCSITSGATSRSVAGSFVKAAQGSSSACATPGGDYWEDIASQEHLTQRSKASHVSEPPLSQPSPLSQATQSSPGSGRLTRSAAKLPATVVAVPTGSSSKTCSTQDISRKHGDRTGLRSSSVYSADCVESGSSSRRPTGPPSTSQITAVSNTDGSCEGDRVFAEAEGNWWSAALVDKRLLGAVSNFTPLASDYISCKISQLSQESQSLHTGQSQTSVMQELQCQHEATLAQHAAVRSAYGQACALEQQLLKASDCGLLAKLSFLDDDSLPQPFTPFARSVPANDHNTNNKPEVSI